VPAASASNAAPVRAVVKSLIEAQARGRIKVKRLLRFTFRIGIHLESPGATLQSGVIGLMSYESRMLEQLAMPRRAEVQNALLRTLLKHGGVVKEFAAGEEVVDELADRFQLNPAQRTAALKTVYRKENRLKKTLLWHRLLFRTADVLATDGLVSRPTQTTELGSS